MLVTKESTHHVNSY